MAADPLPVSQYLNIPAELRALPHWCVWQYQITPYGKTKVPRNPVSHNGVADSTDPSTWVSFETAYANVGRYEGIGFFFSLSSGYVGIDLDYTEDTGLSDKHNLIKTFSKSYAEYSPSGKGVHIICKGTIPRGVKSSSKKIEMYSHSRFFTMTGNVYRDTLPTEEQSMLDFLFNEIGKLKDVEGQEVADKPETEDDQTIYNRAANALNGSKFAMLWQGEWNKVYNSQSEADQALINILGFYSSNFAQIARMFRFSQLGKRDKAKRDNYVLPMIRKAMDNKPPTVEALMNMSADFNKLLEAQKMAAGNSSSVVGEVAQPAAQVTATQGEDAPQVPYSSGKSGRKGFAPPSTNPEWVLNPPPGLIRDAAAFIHDAAHHPVREIALAGAVGLMAGICGRAFNVRGDGLNLYLAMLAQTGRGKEAISRGLGAIQESICMSNPLADGRIVGPSDFASGQGLQRHLSKNPCFVSVIGEFDQFVLRMHGPKANEATSNLKQALLDCYNKSAQGNSFRGSVYSDSKNNIEAVKSPALSFIGECTIAGMKEVVNEKMIQSGMLPRILTFVYDGKRQYENESPLRIQDEQTGLISKLIVLFGACMQMQAQNRPCNIEFTEEANEYRRGLAHYVTDYMNAHSDDAVIQQLYNRAAQNVNRLAALAAITVNGAHIDMQAKIGIHHIMWASCVVWSSIEFWTKCFGNYEVGDQNNELAQLRDCRNAMKNWQKMEHNRKRNYGASDSMINDGVVPMRYLQQTLWSKASFKHPTIQKGDMFRKMIQTMMDNGEVASIKDKRTGINKYGSAQEGFVILALS